MGQGDTRGRCRRRFLPEEVRERSGQGRGGEPGLVPFRPIESQLAPPPFHTPAWVSCPTQQPPTERLRKPSQTFNCHHGHRRDSLPGPSVCSVLWGG